MSLPRHELYGTCSVLTKQLSNAALQCSWIRLHRFHYSFGMVTVRFIIIIASSSTSATQIYQTELEERGSKTFCNTSLSAAPVKWALIESTLLFDSYVVYYGTIFIDRNMHVNYREFLNFAISYLPNLARRTKTLNWGLNKSAI